MHAAATCLLAWATGVGASGSGTVTHLTPNDDWLSVINGEGLAPGDTVILHGGTYMTPDATMLDIAHVGTVDAPITIKAAHGETPIITRNTIGAFDDYYENLEHNVINMRGAQHVVLAGLEITGGNWGIRIGSKTSGLGISPQQPMGEILRPAHHITIRNCHIHHTHNTALSANFPGDVYDTLVIRDNDIHHAGRYGESIYLGAYSSSGQTWSIAKNCVIERNYLHDNVWIGSWFQDPDAPSYHGTAIQLKDGCYNNVIRGNVMHYTRYPAILISGAQSEFGSMGSPDWGPNIVEQNAIWQVSQVPGDNTGQGKQVAADAIVRNNIVYAPQPFYNANHQCLAGNLEVVSNTFISSTPAQLYTLQIADTPSAPITIANNALYRGPGATDVVSGFGSTSAWVTFTSNVAITDLSASLADVQALDFFPLDSSPLVGAADTGLLPAVDFNGTDRTGDATAGAYVHSPGGNPGWTIAPGLVHATSYVRNGSGANPLGFVELSPPIAGKSWVTAADLGASGAMRSLLTVGLGGASSGPLLSGELQGELLALPPYLFDWGTGSHSIAIPSDATLIGIALSTQASRVGSTAVTLMNAIDITIGTF
jgi:hypothetical protein